MREISKGLKDYKMNGEKRFRKLNIERKAVDEESRIVELAFSSEEPYERSFGLEIH